MDGKIQVCYRKVMEISRILHVLRPAAGGMLGHIEVLLKGLGEVGYDIVAAGPLDAKTLNCLRAAKVFDLLPLDIGDRPRLKADLLAIDSLARALRHRSFALVHAHGAKAGLITRLASLRARCACPVIVSYHNAILPPSRPASARKARLYAEKFLKRYTAHFIAVSPHIKSELIGEIGCSETQVSFIANGIPVNALEQSSADGRRSWGWSGDVFVVGTAMRLTREKGIDVLLAAFALAVATEPRLRLVIIGDGPEREWAQGQVSTGGLQGRVRFLGYVPNARRLFPDLDVFVLPSRTEGWPLSVMEAMTCGLPVIASRVGGLPELVPSCDYGVLIEPGEAEPLAAALIALVRDPGEVRRLGKNAAEYAGSNFDARAMVTAIAEIYRRVIEMGSDL